MEASLSYPTENTPTPQVFPLAGRTKASLFLHHHSAPLTVKQVRVVNALPQVHQDVQQPSLAALVISKSLLKKSFRSRLNLQMTDATKQILLELLFPLGTFKNSLQSGKSQNQTTTKSV